MVGQECGGIPKAKEVADILVRYSWCCLLLLVGLNAEEYILCLRCFERVVLSKFKILVILISRSRFLPIYLIKYKDDHMKGGIAKIPYQTPLDGGERCSTKVSISQSHD
jgi:hypothetical protein